MKQGADGGDIPSREDFEQFLEVRQHVKRMQAGTPLLFRTVGNDGREELQICTCWITEDLKTLKWQAQEGNGSTQELPLSAIADVVVENVDDAMEESHFALSVVLRAGIGEGRTPSVVGFICASPEDLISWRDGLKFLAGALPPPGLPRKSPIGMAGNMGEKAATPSSMNATVDPCIIQNSRPPQASGSSRELEQQLKQQTEANEKLQKENNMLREVVKRKDTTIAQLLRDLQNRSTIAERCNKTESTSRESDEHLRDREAMILRRKNRRLQKTLRAKQQTISELLRLVGHVTQQQGAESSAVEDGDDDEDAADSDKSPDCGMAPAPARPPCVYSPKHKKKITEANISAEDAAESDKSPENGMAPAIPVQQSLVNSSQRKTEIKEAHVSTEAGMSTEDVQKMKDMQNRAGSIPCNGVGESSIGSKAALQALAHEMALFEEKKRVVERLARQLEPSSDAEEEEDGFPLR